MSSVRFLGDPLVSVSGQFPLNTCDFRRPAVSDPPSTPEVRPFALRWLIDLGVPAAPTSFRYCPDRQVSVDAITSEPRAPLCKLDWTTRESKDGDEGPSKDYHWETVPEDDD